MGCSLKKSKNAEIIYDKSLPVIQIELEKFKENQLSYFQVLLRDEPETKLNAPIQIYNSSFFKTQHNLPYTSLLQATLFYRAFEVGAFLLQDRFQAFFNLKH